MKKFSIFMILCVSLSLSVSGQTWKHYHSGEGFDSEVKNPWVTNGGTCRTAFTDENGLTKDCTLNVMIDNDSTAIKENDNSKIKSMMIKSHRVVMQGQQTMWQWLIAVPVEFDVEGDESIVDHYELCGYNHESNNTYPLGCDTNGKGISSGCVDSKWNSDQILKEASLNPSETMEIEKSEGTGPKHYNCYQLKGKSADQTPIYSVVPVYEVPGLVPEGQKPSGDIVISCYIKVYYNNGLEPTYHSLTNIKYSEQKIVTDITDVVTKNEDNTMYDLSGRVILEPVKGQYYIKNHKLYQF